MTGGICRILYPDATRRISALELCPAKIVLLGTVPCIAEVDRYSCLKKFHCKLPCSPTSLVSDEVGGTPLVQVIAPWAIANHVTPYQVGGGTRVNSLMFLALSPVVQVS